MNPPQAIHAADIDIGRAIACYLRTTGSATAQELAYVFTESGRADDLRPTLTALVKRGALQALRPKWQPMRYREPADPNS